MTLNDQTHDHSFKIYPRTSINDAPIGTNYLKTAVQDVHVWAPVQHWVFHKTEDNKYHLSIGGYISTGFRDDGVVVSANEEDNEEWEVTYHEQQDAYTIALAKDTTRGWTTPTALELTDKIKIAPLNPQLVPRQLFQLKRDD